MSKKTKSSRHRNQNRPRGWQASHFSKNYYKQVVNHVIRKELDLPLEAFDMKRIK